MLYEVITFFCFCLCYTALSLQNIQLQAQQFRMVFLSHSQYLSYSDLYFWYLCRNYQLDTYRNNFV